MSKDKIVHERISSNMAYLENQITKASKQFQGSYSELMSKAEPYDADGNLVLEMIPGQFTVNCPQSEIDKIVLNARNDMNYTTQCIDELEKVISEIPGNTEYTDEEIMDFIIKVSNVNNEDMRQKRMALANSSNEENNKSIKRNVRSKAKSINLIKKNTKDKDNSDLPKRIVEYGRTLIGTPYVWGGSDIKSHGGLDCSGFVCYSANKCGYKMNRETTKTLINMGKEVSRDELQIGDLIFPKSSHVGFYSGNGKFLHSPKPGDRIKEVDIYGFWRARRIFPGVGGDSNTTPSGGGGTGSYDSDKYYGPGEALELIERTPDPEVTKVIVPQGAASWTTMASYLGVSASTLKKLNPGVTTLFAGTTLYIPTSATTEARQLAAKAKNNVASKSRMLSETSSIINDNIMLTRKVSKASKPSNTSKSSVVEEQTPFQTFLKNEDYIKNYDLKEFKYNQKARMEIRYNNKVRKIQTLIAPIAYTETYSNAINAEKTAGGWFISRHGENLPQLNVSGYMLDTKNAPEKHAFMNEFKNYMTDTVNKTTGDYENNAIIKLVMEGVEYQGHVTSITFNKDANRPTLYTFNLNFTCIYYKNVRDVQSAVKSLTPSSGSSSSKRSLYLGDSTAAIINGK